MRSYWINLIPYIPKIESSGWEATELMFIGNSSMFNVIWSIHRIIFSLNFKVYFFYWLCLKYISLTFLSPQTKLSLNFVCTWVTHLILWPTHSWKMGNDRWNRLWLKMWTYLEVFLGSRICLRKTYWISC